MFYSKYIPSLFKQDNLKQAKLKHDKALNEFVFSIIPDEESIPTYCGKRNLLELSVEVARLKYVLLKSPMETRQGRIWKAYDTLNNRYVGVKEASTYCVENQKNIYGHSVAEDVINESLILTQLQTYPESHPGIVKIYNTWKTDESYFMAFEWCDGGNLSTKLPRNQKRNNKFYSTSRRNYHNEFVGSVASQITNSIAYLHDKQIVHGDLSLDNIMLIHKKSKQIRIIDFGLARIGNTNLHEHSAGKTSYMSPECYDGKKDYDGKKNDVWCFGVCLFILLFGMNPYDEPFKNDFRFQMIWNGKLRQLLQKCGVTHFAQSSAIDLLEKIFRPQNERLSMKQILKHPWIRDISSRY
jgi:serine/threonine protein kinase